MDITEKTTMLNKMIPLIEEQDEVKQARIMGYVEGLSASKPLKRSEPECKAEEEAKGEEEQEAV